MPIFHVACPDHQTTSIIVVIFDNVRGSIPTPRFSPDGNMSRVAVRKESRLITEENLSSVILCSRQVFSVPCQTVLFVVYIPKDADYEASGIQTTCIKGYRNALY
ncbi:hypothetical protein TNCV_4969241 [Trichonephila clavipes]|nr:hypothetical protein TNCV_4969241 [Trichonephila clavipes]